jgi:hypothetical protein
METTAHPSPEAIETIITASKQVIASAEASHRHIIASFEAAGILQPAKWHGTHNGYINHGCRCPQCREARATYMRERRARS